MVAKRMSAKELALPLTRKEDRLSTKAERQEFFLPVTGFAWFYPEEVAVINHPASRGLNNPLTVKQLKSIEGAPGDYDAIRDRAAAGTQALVRRLTDRIMSEVEQDLKAEGESRSPQQMEGLRWAADVLARKVYEVAKPL